MRPILTSSFLRQPVGIRFLSTLPDESEALWASDACLRSPAIKIFLQLDTASSDATKTIQQKCGRTRAQHEGPIRINILKIPLEEKLRCERILRSTTFSRRPLEILLGASSIRNIRGHWKRDIVISARSKSSALQESIATFIRRHSELPENKWWNDWMMEPVIWMGIRLTQAKAHAIMMALNKWYTTSDPMNVRAVGLGMEWTSHDGEILSRGFPFLVRTGDEDKLDFDLSSALGADTRGLFQPESDDSKFSQLESPPWRNWST